MGSSFSSARRRPAFIAGDDHLAHGGDAVALEEHVLGAAEPDALGAEVAGDPRVARRIGVGAHLEAAVLVRPPHQLREALVRRRIRRRQHPIDHAHHLARLCREVAEKHAPGPAVERDPIALGDDVLTDAHAALLIGDLERRAPTMAHLPMPRATTAA
jgi:hypothetical protein